MASTKDIIHVRLPNKLHKDLKVFCAKTDDTKTDIVNLAISQFLERERKNG